MLNLKLLLQTRNPPLSNSAITGMRTTSKKCSSFWGYRLGILFMLGARDDRPKKPSKVLHARIPKVGEAIHFDANWPTNNSRPMQLKPISASMCWLHLDVLTQSIGRSFTSTAALSDLSESLLDI
jgi:hypothetical protein